MVENIASLIGPVKAIAIEAGHHIMKIYQHDDVKIQRKIDNSPITAADKAAHTCIIAGLKKLTPELQILSEETQPLPLLAERQQWQRYWLVDPLDGTKEFIEKTDDFTVNIALIEGHEVVLGVVYAPVSGEMYWGVKHGGAFKQLGETITPIQVKKAKRDAPLIMTSRRHGGEQLDAWLKTLPDYKRLHVGSSLKICYVAEGRADLYPRLGPTSEWDTAAAQCILQEAGGLLCGKSAEPLRYNTGNTLLNPHFIAIADKYSPWLPGLLKFMT